MICPKCGIPIEHNITDLDLAPIRRVHATFWEARYYNAMLELTKANKGIRRLHKRIEGLKGRL